LAVHLAHVTWLRPVTHPHHAAGRIARREPAPAPRGTKNGNFRNGNWTAEAIEERRWLRSRTDLCQERYYRMTLAHIFLLRLETVFSYMTWKGFHPYLGVSAKRQARLKIRLQRDRYRTPSLPGRPRRLLRRGPVTRVNLKTAKTLGLTSPMPPAYVKPYVKRQSAPNATRWIR
jgi:hypothetical protein